MQHLAAPKLLALLLAIGSLVGCGPPPAPPAALAPQTSPEATWTSTPTPLSTLSAAAAASPTTSPPSPTLASTSHATASPTLPPAATSTATSPPPSTTPLPTQPALLTPVAGRPLEFSLGWRFGSNGHLADTTIIYQARKPVLVVASLDRNTYALNGGGEILWKTRTEGPAYALAALDGEWVATADDTGAVTLLNEQGGRLWRHELGSRVTALEAGRQGGLLAGGWQEGPPQGGQLALLNTEGEERRVRWQVSLDSPVTDVTIVPGDSLSNVPEEDLAVGATLNGEVRALELTGLEKWRFDAGASVTGLGPLEAEGDSRVLVGTQDGRLLALDAGTGGAQRSQANTERLLWQHVLGEGGPVWHTADLDGDPDPEIVAGTGGQAPLLALLSAQGEVLWRIAMASPVNAIVSADMDGDGRLEVLAGLASGEIQAYDARGQLRGSIHAGLPVWALAAGEDGSVFALADVVAWQIRDMAGPAGGPWLPPPAMVSASEDSLGSPPRAASAAKDGSKAATLVFLGDIAPGRSMEAQLARYGPAAPWEGLAPLLETADLAVANLECVLTTQGRPLDKEYLIRAHPLWAQTLVDAGLDLVTVANNHALDYGQIGLDETLETLRGSDIAAIGARASDDSSQNHRPTLFNLNGVRVAVLGYAALRWNGSADVPATDRVAWAEPGAVQASVRATREQADLVVVLLHAGTEYADEPSPGQMAVARAAIDAGAALVVGHHPHVTQTVEQYKQGLIVYSLGDALFDIPRPAAMRGDLLRVHVTEEGLAEAELWPFWIEDAFRPRFLDNGEGTPRVETIYP